MKQLRITTSTPGFMGQVNEPLVTVKNKGKFIPLNNPQCENIYIHGKAMDLAGYDIPIVIDGDFNNIHLPIKEQDILLMLPNGNYKCKCSIEKDMITNAYYITLLDKDDNNKDDNDDDNTIQCMGGFYTK
jgi:hypothetical protein